MLYAGISSTLSAVKKETLFYFRKLEQGLAGPYDLIQMAGLLRNKIIKPDTPTCLEDHQDQWMPFQERPEYIIVQEIPADAVSVRTQMSTDETSTYLIPLPSTETIIKLVLMGIGLAVSCVIVFFVAKSDPIVGLALAILASGTSCAATCFIIAKLLDEDFMTLLMIIFIPFADIFYFISNLPEYLTLLCAKYIGATLAAVALAGIAESSSPNAAAIFSFFAH